MKKKENQRIALTKRLLKENLLQLMTHKSVQEITVKELCEAAEINRSTFYNHYGCPADVLKDIELSVIDDLASIWVKDHNDKDWSIGRRVETLCTYLQEHLSLSKLLFRETDTNSEFATLLFQSSHVQTSYEEMFSYVKNQDSKRLMITFLSNGTYHMIRQWLLDDIPKTPKEMGELVQLVAAHGWENATGTKK